MRYAEKLMSELELPLFDDKEFKLEKVKQDKLNQLKESVCTDFTVNITDTRYTGANYFGIGGYTLYKLETKVGFILLSMDLVFNPRIQSK
jgi:hypothetical protein